MNKDLNLLIIETNPKIGTRLKQQFGSLGVRLCDDVAPEETVNHFVAAAPDVAVLGPSLNALNTQKCIHKLKVLDHTMPILTACKEDSCLFGGTTSAPFDGIYYFDPNIRIEEIGDLLDQAVKYKEESQRLPDYPIIVGQTPAINEVRDKIRKVSDKDITVLVTGESGTGKELIARSLHYHSPRNKAPLVKINCGALPDELLESEVFGFQRGAFTGAHKDKPGRFELAEGGTLFIDEIGDLSLSLQVKFLQVLEEKAFSRLGGTKDRVVDTRVVAATNSDLWKKVEDGAFRKDLFYRLNVVQINVPPMRERKDDIPLLLHYFLNKYAYELKREPLEISDRASSVFMAYAWPGNVRELENLIRRFVVIGSWEPVLNDLDLRTSGNNKFETSSQESEDGLIPWDNEKISRFLGKEDFSLKHLTNTYVAEVERELILKALEETHWNRRKAAQLLNVSYKTLLNRLAEFDLKH